MLRFAKSGLTLAFLVQMPVGMAAILAPVPAMADPPDAESDQQAAANQGPAPDSTQENDGFDITRPQTAFEVRGLDQESSSPTSKTNKAEALLRIQSKIPLDAGWRLGLLAQVPLVGKTTTDFNPASVTHVFGLGDTVFQAFVAHDLDERWAIGVAARVSAETGAGSLGSGEWQTMPGLGVRCSLPELGEDSYFVPSMRWAFSSPTNPGQRRIDEPQIAPTLNIDFCNIIPKQRYTHQFRRPGSRSDWAAVPPLRCLDRRKIDRQGPAFVRRQRANHQ